MNRRTILIGGGAAAVAAAGAALVEWRDMGSMAEYDAATTASRAALAGQPSLEDLVRFATLAPNGHNSQPWRFRIGAHQVDILPDLARRTPVVDPDDHHLFVSLGCATENLVLGAAARGHRGEAVFDPRQGGGVGFAFRSGKPVEDALFRAIPRRQSTRGVYDGQPVSSADLRTLAAAAVVPGVETTLLTQRRDIAQVRDLVLAGNAAQMGDAAFRRELKHWLRFNPRDALRTRDGLFSVASGSPALPSWAGPFLFDRLERARSEKDRYARQLDSSAGVAVFLGARADPEHWVLVGRACQRFALQATALGLKCAFINQPVEVASLRPELVAMIGAAGMRPDLVMRFGRGSALPFSMRRPVPAVLG